MSESCDLTEGANYDRYCLTHKCQAVAPVPLCWKARAEAAEAEVKRLTAELSDRDRRIEAALALISWPDAGGWCDCLAHRVERILRGESDE